jgi:hypothetical protein
MHEYEFESEWEGESEFEYEGEMEGEEFFGRIAQMARRAAQNPALRRIGLQAARSALGGLRGAGPAGAMASNVLGGFLPQREYEGEFESEYEGEGEFESEDFVNPQRRLSRGPSSEALMAHLGNAAASAESEDEAEAFIGALVPLAARLIPRVAPAVMRAAPQLIRGISNVAQRLRSNPATQQLVRTLPTIARNTVGSLARQVGQGRPITPQTAVRTLAQQTARVIGNPRAATAAYQRNRALDRRYHQAVARPTGRPVPPRPPYRARPNYPPRPVYTPRPRYTPRPGYGVGAGAAGGAMHGGFPGGMPGGYPGATAGGGYPGGMPDGGAGAYPGVDAGGVGGGYVDPAAAGGYADPSGGGYADPTGGGYDDGGGGYDGGGYDVGGDGGGYAPSEEEMYF